MLTWAVSHCNVVRTQTTDGPFIMTIKVIPPETLDISALTTKCAVCGIVVRAGAERKHNWEVCSVLRRSRNDFYETRFVCAGCIAEFHDRTDAETVEAYKKRKTGPKPRARVRVDSSDG